MIKEKPILFNGPMVNAILAGRKTQTRRVIKNLNGVWRFVETNYSKAEPYKAFIQDKYGDYHPMPCPHGEIGDHLWVKETWQAWKGIEGYSEFQPWDGKIADAEGCTLIKYRSTSESLGPWRPSIFMPRWANRITLEIMNIRVERLQDISHQDAFKEGFQYNTEPNNYGTGGRARDWFAELWDSINGKKHPWKSNPWVWVIAFKKI